MKILKNRRLLLVPLLVVVPLLALTIAYASSTPPQSNTFATTNDIDTVIASGQDNDQGQKSQENEKGRQIKGEGTFTDRKGGEDEDDQPGPEVLEVKVFEPGEVPTPGTELQVVDPTEFPDCGGFVEKYAFDQGLDVTCFQRLILDFTGTISGFAILDETFTVYGDGEGGHFAGPAIFEGEVIDPKTGDVMGEGRIDFFPNEGIFGPDFVGSGEFKVRRAYGDLEELTGSGTFEGVIGDQGTYEITLRCPCFKKSGEKENDG